MKPKVFVGAKDVFLDVFYFLRPEQVSREASAVEARMIIGQLAIRL